MSVANRRRRPPNSVLATRAEDSQAVIQARPFTWRADLPPPLGGSNEAPSPTALLLGALAGCAVVFIRDTLAPQLGVRVTDVAATVKCETDARGLLGLEGAKLDLRNLSLDVTGRVPGRRRGRAEDCRGVAGTLPHLPGAAEAHRRRRAVPNCLTYRRRRIPHSPDASL